MAINHRLFLRNRLKPGMIVKFKATTGRSVDSVYLVLQVKYHNLHDQQGVFHHAIWAKLQNMDTGNEIVLRGGGLDSLILHPDYFIEGAVWVA